MTRRPPKLILSAIAALVAVLAPAATASAAAPPPMTVALHQPSHAPLSYFQLRARPGRRLSAGTLEVRNASDRALHLALDPIDAVTTSTLGSAYDVRGLSIHGAARWIRLARRRVVLPPHGRASVAISLIPGRGARPGDYLGGIGVQALGRPQQTNLRANVAVSSTQRYAVGVEIRLPGPRHPLIAFTGAKVARDPAGVAFSLLARNRGNVILQNVHGSAVITRGRRVVARAQIGPGTFVTGTSISYPILARRERPRQGDTYRVRAVMHYRGGTARLDQLVRFGHSDAVRQEKFGGPKAPSGNGFPLLLAAVAALLLALAMLAALLLRRRRQSPIKTLEWALAGARESGNPLSLITVARKQDETATRPTASVLRSRLRRTDRLCSLNGHGHLVVAPDTDTQTADLLAADLRRLLAREQNGSNGVAIEVHSAVADNTAAELFDRIAGTNGNAPPAEPAS
ncbi:MAG: hypothetical protein ABR581_03035 [Thermoleophilaceae bacterium]